MKSLFVRIFVWFWFAMIVVIAAIVVSIVGLPFGPPRAERGKPLIVTLETVGQLALDVLRREGPAALQSHLANASDGGEIRFFVYSDAYEELAARRAPPHIRPLVDLARRDHQFHLGADAGGFMFAKTVFSERGDSIVVVSQGPAFASPLRSVLDPLLIGLRVGILLFVGGLVCYGLARSLTAPLRQLSHAANQLALGNLTARSGPTLRIRKDEIGDLARVFDRMAEEIEALVTSQRRLLQDVSHELRSPLARLNVALALARQKSPAQASGAFDRMEREAERLNRLIGELLTLNVLESETEPWTEEVDVAALVETAVEDARFEAAARGVAVRFAELQPCRVRGNLDLLYRAVDNILRNAVHHTADGTEVEAFVRISTDQKPEVLIGVRDHGPGVPEEELQRIAEPFYKSTTTSPGTPGGVGLGLAIVQRVIQRFGGRIVFRNASDGGLIAELYLPLRDA